MAAKMEEDGEEEDDVDVEFDYPAEEQRYGPQERLILFN